MRRWRKVQREKSTNLQRKITFNAGVHKIWPATTLVLLLLSYERWNKVRAWNDDFSFFDKNSNLCQLNPEKQFFSKKAPEVVKISS